MFDLFLVGYVNGLRAFLEKSQKRGALSKRVSTDAWFAALRYAEGALAMSRHAVGVAAEGDGVRAERVAAEALVLLERSVDEAPGMPKEVPSFLDAWCDSGMLEIPRGVR